MKKIISILSAISLLASTSVATFGADKEARQPDVYVDGEIVEFADQNAYITDEGRTLVPARGVFEAMNCEVSWNAENYTVTVSNQALKKEILLTINDTAMKVVTDGEEEIKTLDVPAALMNDRTMIPLRAVSEALESVVVWNPGDYSVYISMSEKISIDQFPSFSSGAGSTDKQEDPEAQEPIEEPEIKDEDKLLVSIETEADDVNAGDEITIYVSISNVPEVEDVSVNAITCMLEYDKACFEFVSESATVIDQNGEAVAFGIALDNSSEESGTRFVFIDVNGASLSEDGGKILKMKFKVLDDNGGKITLVNNYDSEVGYDTTVYIFGGDGSEAFFEGNNMRFGNTQIELK